MHCTTIFGIIHELMKIQQTILIPESLKGMRLDQALAKLLPNESRTQIQAWIKNAEITVNSLVARARHPVKGGETVVLSATRKAQPVWDAEEIALDIVYEDDALLVISKPVGMVVHPAAGHRTSTLLNALLHHAPALKELPRAGILHRLDKNTSGLLVIAKTHMAFIKLSRQLKKREITRIYQAIVSGVLTSGGSINQPIGRHPVKRQTMAVIETGKPAVTHYRVLERYRAHTRVKVQLETGRTHQIRVHMAYIQYPLVGDPTYGGRLQLPKGASQALIQALRQCRHQALHASELSFIHPMTQKLLSFQAPLPMDMQRLIDILKQDCYS
ncbi:MAG: rluD [Gammaproteobacteria bacterium]|nr:rluD [Gammaproteobacteria bacterium]